MLGRDGYVLDKSKYNKEVLDSIRKDLTVEPFILKDYKFGNEDDMKFNIYHENDKYISIPRQYGIEKFGKPKAKYGKKNKAKIKFKGDLRDYQKKIMDQVMPKLKKTGGGLISIPPGRGKTVLAIWLAAKLKLKTLVIVHKTFLMDQWKERIEMFTESTVGKIQQKTVDIEHDFVLGMLQSISMRDYDTSIYHGFDLVIIDEMHHISSKVFSKALLRICAPYMIGLSATPKRFDRLEKVFEWFCGGVLYEDKHLVKTTDTLEASSTVKLIDELREEERKLLATRTTMSDEE